MARRVNPDLDESRVKQRYRATSWSGYERVVVHWGSLTDWVEDANLRAQWTQPPPEGRGCTRTLPSSPA